MKHEDMQHIQKFEEISDHWDQVVVFLEDMRAETGNLPNKKTSLLCRDTLRALDTIEKIIEHVKTNK